MDNQAGRNGDGINIADGSAGNVIKDNSAVNNSRKGVQLFRGASNNEVINNTASNNGRLGFQLHQSDWNLLKNNTAISNANQGYLLVNASGNVLRKNLANSNGKSAYEARGGSENNTVEKLRIGSSAPISFAGGDVTIQLAPSHLTPSEKSVLGAGIQITGMNGEDEVNVTFHLSEMAIDEINESTLAVWRYDGHWTPISSQFDSQTRELSATVTAESEAIIPVYEIRKTPNHTAVESPTAKDTETPTQTPDNPVTKTKPTETTSVSQPGFGLTISIAALMLFSGFVLGRRHIDCP